jgi:hypothetical protein
MGSGSDQSPSNTAVPAFGAPYRLSSDGTRSWMSLIAACAAGLLALAGCQNMVAESGLYYNDGLATSFNRLLLANVIRSAKGQPTYYSAIGDYSASTSTSSSPGFSADFPINALNEGDLSVNLAPNRSRDRNANVSSLESKDFTQAMHTPISPNLAVFIFTGRDGLHLDLATTLTIKRLALSAGEYEQLAVEAVKICNTKFTSLPSARRGICENFSTVLADAACGGDNLKPADAIVELHNDPTNACEYAKFRLFAEAMAVIRPHLSIDKDGNTVFSLGIGSSTRRLFGTKGAGYVLRSPNEVIQYLGEIVRVRYEQGAAATPQLSSRNGKSVPIFVAESGPSAKRAADSVKVDGKVYALPDQRLGDEEKDYSYRSLSIVKDLLTLNTSDDQLPKSPTIILGGSNN